MQGLNGPITSGAMAMLENSVKNAISHGLKQTL